MPCACLKGKEGYRQAIRHTRLVSQIIQKLKPHLHLSPSVRFRNLRLFLIATSRRQVRLHAKKQKSLVFPSLRLIPQRRCPAVDAHLFSPFLKRSSLSFSRLRSRSRT